MNAQRHRTLWMLYTALFFFSFHSYFLLYVQSSFINQFIAESDLTVVYGIAALGTLFLFILAPRILRRYINSKIGLFLIVIEAVLCGILTYSQTPLVIIAAFILQQILNPLIFYTFDILIEHNRHSNETGHIRGWTFTAANIAMVISPIAAGYASTHFGLQSIYPFSLIFLIPLLLVLRTVEKSDHALVTSHTSIFQVLRTFWSTKSHGVRLVFMIDLILNIFYAWMTIYAPIYLQHQGFTWDQIGIMFSIMLLPFLLFELPLGILADRAFSTKKILFTGVIIMTVSIVIFGYSQSTSIFVWSVILFMTRVGASFVESMAETYFFKHISTRDIYTLALFRANRPLSQIIGPLIASLSLWYVGESTSYVILALIVLYSLRYIIPLPDSIKTA